MEFSHIPVLFHEALDALDIRPEGVYVDCTAGGGGHAVAIAEKLTAGTLIAIDRDPEAIETLNRRFAGDKHIIAVKENFVNIRSILRQNGFEKADGILADLGVSSRQLDTPERGFSFHHDAPLDMRMSREGRSAADLVNGLTQRELQDILYRYGEEKFAPAIARGIVKARDAKPVETTFELVEIIKAAIPAAARREGGHPARRTFQALRIEVNGEISLLGEALANMFDSLKPSGRLAVITFHSLEDRIVKQFFASLCAGCVCPSEFPVCRCANKPRGKLPFKAKAPAQTETEQNTRSRSARLRVIERTGEGVG